MKLTKELEGKKIIRTKPRMYKEWVNTNFMSDTPAKEVEKRDTSYCNEFVEVLKVTSGSVFYESTFMGKVSKYNILLCDYDDGNWELYPDFPEATF